MSIPFTRAIFLAVRVSCKINEVERRNKESFIQRCLKIHLLDEFILHRMPYLQQNYTLRVCVRHLGIRLYQCLTTFFLTDARPLQQPVPTVRVIERRALKRTPILEVFVVADKSMVAFHGNQTVRQYVMTIMSMVRKYYFIR